MPAPFDLAQHVVSSTIFRTIAPQNTVPSGECGINPLHQEFLATLQIRHFGSQLVGGAKGEAGTVFVGHASMVTEDG
jgi:hypothetical protein